jgi:hypothetical protein
MKQLPDDLHQYHTKQEFLTGAQPLRRFLRHGERYRENQSGSCGCDKQQCNRDFTDALMPISTIWETAQHELRKTY